MEPGVRTIILDEVNLPRLDQADTAGVTEEDFVQVALKVLRRLHPDCFVFRFTAQATTDDAVRCPDVAIVDHAHQYWFVVEIELTAHSLGVHVLPQARVLRDGLFGESAVQAFVEQVGVTPDVARTMLKYLPRYTAVVADAERADWRAKLTAENIQFLSVARFERATGLAAFLASGSLAVGERCIGFARVHGPNRALRISPHHGWEVRAYVIIEPTGSSSWTAIEAEGELWLMKDRGPVTAAHGSYVQLIKRHDGAIELRSMM